MGLARNQEAAELANWRASTTLCEDMSCGRAVYSLPTREGGGGTDLDFSFRGSCQIREAHPSIGARSQIGLTKLICPATSRPFYRAQKGCANLAQPGPLRGTVARCAQHAKRGI